MRLFTSVGVVVKNTRLLLPISPVTLLNISVALEPAACVRLAKVRSDELILVPFKVLSMMF